MADEQPRHVVSEEVVAEPEDKPAKGTAEYAELQQFSTEVVLILQTVNDTEHKAALSVLEPPSANFTAPVIFPMPNMVAGKLEGWKVALIKAGPGRAVGDYVEDALNRYCNARYVIGVGVCFAFVQEDEANQCKFADVLVSNSLRDNSYMKFEDNEIKDLGQKINVIQYLQQIFCLQGKKQLKFKVSASRMSEMYCGTFCCNTFLIKDAAIRDAFHRLNTRDIGGEMEGGELLKLQQDGKVKGVIVIKGVADFADKDKAKHWQYTAAKAALHYIKVQLRNTDEPEVPEKKVSTTSMTSPNGSAVPHQLGGSSNLPVDITPNGNTLVPAALPNHHATAAVPTSSSRMATDSDQDHQTALHDLLVARHDYLADGLEANLSSLTTNCYSRFLITEETYKKTMQLNATDREKVKMVLLDVQQKVKQDPKKFYEFVAVLMELSCCAHLVASLTSDANENSTMN